MPNQPIPTENDLARDYGACRSTVRRAIRELELAGLLRAARGKGRIVVPRADSRGRMIGLISSGGDLEGGSGFQIAQGLLKRVGKERDHLATFAFSDVSDMPVTEVTRSYSGLAAAGILGPIFPSAAIVELARRIPVIALARDEEALGIPSFYVDYGYHAFTAAMHLLRRGHRRIVVTHGKKGFFNRVGSNIRQGVEWAYCVHGEDPQQIIPLEVALGRGGGEELFQAVVDKALHPTAILSYGTWALSDFLREADARSAGDLCRVEGIILNDLEDESLLGRVSHFRCPYRQLADEAVATLYELLQGGTASKIHNAYRGEMILGSNEN